MRIKLEQIAKRQGIKITYLESTTSTNSVALEGGYRHAELIIANHQSQGRGQRGNRWESGLSENLTFSLVIEPHWLGAEHQFLLSKLISLALTDCLDTYGIATQIKWTNDIYVEGRKVAGILIESEIMGDRVARSVLGVGLNVNQTVFSRELPNPTSMALESSRRVEVTPSLEQKREQRVETVHRSDIKIDRTEVLERFLSGFWQRWQALRNGDVHSLEADYHKRLYLLDTPHRYTLANGEMLVGSIRSVKSSGELVVEGEDGSANSYLFGEIIF